MCPVSFRCCFRCIHAAKSEKMVKLSELLLPLFLFARFSSVLFSVFSFFFLCVQILWNKSSTDPKCGCCILCQHNTRCMTQRHSSWRFPHLPSLFWTFPAMRVYEMIASHLFRIFLLGVSRKISSACTSDRIFFFFSEWKNEGMNHKVALCEAFQAFAVNFFGKDQGYSEVCVQWCHEAKNEACQFHKASHHENGFSHTLRWRTAERSVRMFWTCSQKI